MSKKALKAPVKKAAKVTKVQKAWSDRFVFDQIPKYAGEEMPKRNMYLDSLLIITEKDPKKVKNKRAPGLAETTVKELSLDELILRLEELWELNGIPEAQRAPFRECIKALEESACKDFVVAEINELEQNKANVQLSLRAVAAREESLKSLKEMQQFLLNSPDWDKVKEVQLEAAELLHAHRMLTLNCVESIVKWRNQLSEAVNLPPFNFPFMWEGENYLLKLKDDLDFLKVSEYAKVLYFGEDYDPFLVCPSVPAGKLEKSRKRDANYFVNDGQVIVPLPSTITGRVKDAEDVLRKEWDWIQKLKDNDPKRLADLFGKEIRDEYIEEVIEEFFKELESSVNKEKAEDEARRKKQAEDDELAQRIYFDLFNGLDADLYQIAENEYLTEKALRDSKEKNLKDENDRLARLIYKSLKDQVIELTLNELAEALLKEAEEDENQGSSDERGNIIEELGLDFAGADAFAELGGIMWVPIGISEDLIPEAMQEYYRFIPSTNKEVVPTIDLLLLEVTKHSDTRWYWAIKNRYIFALLVFSIDCFNKNGRKLIVHHISSLYWRAFPAIIESATEHLFKIDSCDEARICMFSPIAQDLSPDIKKVMNQTKYRWKSGDSLKEGGFNITVFGRFRGKEEDERPAFMPFRLKAVNFLHADENPVPANNAFVDDMMQIANRPIFLNSLLALIGRLEKASIKITGKFSNTLQAELSAMLETMNRTQSFSFPNLKSIVSSSQAEIDEFCRSINIPSVKIMGSRLSISELELNFRWISCTNVTEVVKGHLYQYMRFRSKDITVTKVADSEIITIPTEMPNISAFFISSKLIQQELSKKMNEKLDLFYVTDTLLLKGSPSNSHEVWVPCFNKASKYFLPWAEGYEIVPQTDEKSSSFITKSTEDAKLEINQSIIKEGLLVIGKKKGPVLTNDFIFGLKYTKGDKILDIPLFSCLVQQSDWVRAKA